MAKLPDIAVEQRPTPNPPESVAQLPSSTGMEMVPSEQEVASGNEFTQFGVKLMQQQDEADVDNANTAYDNARRQVLFGPNGFYNLKGQDAMAAMQPTTDSIEALRQQTRDGLQTAEAKRMFDYISRRATQTDLRSMALHSIDEGNKYALSTKDAAIQNEVNNSALYWNDDERFGDSLGKIAALAQSRAQLLGQDSPDVVQANITHYQSEAWQARIRSVMAQDADVARTMFNNNAENIDASHRAQLDSQITQAQYTQMIRSEAMNARDERQADKQFRSYQTNNEAQLFASAIQGKFPSAADLADMVRTQQISKSGWESMMALERRGEDDDNSPLALKLAMQAYNGDINVNDIYSAAKSGQLKRTTAMTLMAIANSKDTKSDNLLTRQARSSVMDAAGVPDSMINLTHDDALRKAQAETEWTNRVIVGGEDPITVRDDMMNKYTPPGKPPLSWPAPRMGQIMGSDDIPKVWQKTKDALANGLINQNQFDSEANLLKKYKQFYDQLNAAKQAKQTVQAKPKSNIPNSQPNSQQGFGL